MRTTTGTRPLGADRIVGAVIAVLLVMLLLPAAAMVRTNERGGSLLRLAAIALVMWLGVAGLVIWTSRTHLWIGAGGAVFAAALALYAAAYPKVHSYGLGAIDILGAPFIAGTVLIFLWIVAHLLADARTRGQRTDHEPLGR